MTMNTTPHPDAGEVHIYTVILPHSPPELERLGRFLSATETDRARLLMNDQIRMRFIAGRGILRGALGSYLGVAPENVPLAAGEHGKPCLTDNAKNLRFNLSHAGDLLVLAVTVDLEVGVDIEKIEADKPVHDMARIAFSRREQEELLSLPFPLQTDAFYRCWVRKESCLKACGSGFSFPSNSFYISTLKTETPLLTTCCSKKWHVLDIQVPQGYCAALAVEASCSSLPPPVLKWQPKPRHQPENDTVKIGTEY